MPEHAPQKEVAVGSTVKSEMEGQAAPFRLIEGDPFLQMHSCRAEFAEPQQGITHSVVGVSQ
jgi:hypothetical protein